MDCRVVSLLAMALVMLRLTNEMADCIIEAMERDKASPPKPRRSFSSSPHECLLAFLSLNHC
jgi:hypothetical protein